MYHSFCSEMKKLCASDERYIVVKSSKVREEIFYDYVKDLSRQEKKAKKDAR